ncbi:MAG: hypothetical protein ACPGOY_02445 [Rhodospirillaceae bacterium]
MGFHAQFGSWVAGLISAVLALFFLGGAAGEPSGSNAYVVFMVLVFACVGFVFRLIVRAFKGYPPFMGWVGDKNEGLDPSDTEPVFTFKPNAFVWVFCGLFLLSFAAVMIGIEILIAPAAIAAAYWMVKQWRQDSASHAAH